MATAFCVHGVSRGTSAHVLTFGTGCCWPFNDVLAPVYTGTSCLQYVSLYVPNATQRRGGLLPIRLHYHIP